MPGDMDWVIKVRMQTNIPAVMQEVKAAAAALKSSGADASGGQFAAVAGAARQRVESLGAEQGMTAKSLGRHLKDLDKVLQQVTEGNLAAQRALRQGGVPLSGRSGGATDLSPLSRVAKAAESRRKGAEFGANVETKLADDDLYKAATKQATVARARIAADVQTMLAGDSAYIGATKQSAVARQRISADVQTMLAGDDAYIGATKRLAVARQRISADVQSALAGDESYKAATKQLTVARARIAADVQTALTGDSKYREATKKSALARERQGANLQEDLNNDSGYRSATKRLAVARQVQQKNLQEGLAGDTTYREATKRLAVVREVQNARLQEGLVGDVGYTDATKRIAVARAQQGADLQQGLAGDANYQKATLNTAVARQAQQAKLQEGLAGDQAYGQASRRAAAAKAQQQATLQSGLATDQGYADATRRATVAKQQQQATLQSALAADPQYKEATLRAAVARQRQNADLQQGLAGDAAYRTATVDATRARATIKAKVAESLSGDEGYKAATVRATIAREQQKADIQSRLAADPAYAAATVQATAAREKQTATVKAGLASDQTYITATAKIAKTREEQAARVTLARGGETASQGLIVPGAGPARELSENEHTQLLARAALVERSRADLQAAANARLALAEGTKGVAASTEKRIAESQLAVALRREEKAAMKAAIKSGEVDATRFQRLQAMASPTAKAPTEFQTIGQMALQKTITTGGYAVGGMVAGAALFGTIEAVKEASKLQEQFAGLKGQMEAIGQAGSFAMVRDKIKGISNETGVAAGEVTKFAARLLGVFNDPNVALRETESAMKLAVVSGTDLGTMIEELVPIATQFGTSISDIGDLAVSIHDKFGIAEEATLHFLGEVAPLAQEAGLSLEEMGVLGATAANSMGKSITVAAEQFSKVLPTMQGNQDKIFQILRSNPRTAEAVDPIVQAYGRGESGEAFKLILAQYNKLDRVQQDNLVRVSGSRREWALLNGLFNNSSKVLNDMAEAEAKVGTNKGALDRRFQDVSGTLNRTFERIQQGFKNAIEGILGSGIGDALAAIGKGIEMAVGLVNLLTSAFITLNDVLKLPGMDSGILVPLVQFAAAAYIANKAMQVFGGISKGMASSNFSLSRTEDGLSASITRRSVATAAGETTLASDTTLKGANAAATGEAAAAETVLAGRRYSTNASGLITPAGAAASNAAGTGIRGWLGGQVGNSPLLTRGLAGGRYFQDSTAVTSANTSAAATGSATGVGMVSGAAIALIGAAMVKNARDEQSENLNVASNELREKMKTATNARLHSIANQYDGFWDEVQQGFFSVDLPGEIAKQEFNRRTGAKGAEIIGIAVSKGISGNLVDEMSDQAIADINTYMSKNVQTMDFAQTLGVSTDKGIFGNVLDKLTGRGAGSIISKLTGVGWGAEILKGLGIGKGKTTLDRAELKKLLPEIKKRAEAGDGNADTIAKEIEDALTSSRPDSETRMVIRQALADNNPAKAIEEAGGIDSFLQKQGLYDPKGQYQTGQIGRGRYIGLVRQRVADLQKQIAGAPDAEKAQKEFDAALKEAQDLQDVINLERVESLKMTAPMTEFLPKTKIFTALLEAVPTLSIPKQVEKIPELIQGNWDAFQDRLSLIQDPNQYAAAALAGVDIDPTTKILQTMKSAADLPSIGKLLETGKGWVQPIWSAGDLPEGASKEVKDEWEKRNREITGNLDATAKAKTPQTVEELNKEIAEKSAAEGITYKDAFLKIAKEREAYQLAVHPDMPSPYTQLIKDIEANPDIVNVEALVQSLAPPAEIVEKNRIDQVSQAKKAQIALRASQSGTSPYVAAAANIASAREELDRLLLQKSNLTGGVNIDAEIAQAQAAVNTALQQSQAVVDATAAAMDNWAVVMANGDPIVETDARISAAENALTRLLAEAHGDERDPRIIQARQALQQLRFQQIDNINARIKSEMDLVAFDRNRNPEKAAQDAIDAANFAIATAKGETARNQGVLALKQALRQAADAEEAWLQAVAQSDITTATIGQDPVAAATRAVKEAERRLEVAKAQDLGRSVLKQLTDDLAQKRSDAIDIGVSQQTDLIDYMLTMGQITTSQAIERLKVERDKYVVNSKKWRDIQLKIHSLEQGSKADSQFNLPANIALPTLYEARRLNQSRAMGIGYMDNRSIALTFNVDGAQDPAAVSTQILNAMQSALGGGGQIYTPGITVGAYN